MRAWEPLRDQALTEEILDCLAHDRRSSEHDLSINVRGGVAHISGRVRGDEDRRLLRRVIGRMRGIFAVWDLLQTSEDEPIRVIDIGCGSVKQLSSSIGVDHFLQPAVDVLTDVERGLPFLDDSIDQVFAVHILEHVQDVVALMNEAHRVLKRNGVLHILTPYWRSGVAAADPTHIHFFSTETFKYFCHTRPGLLAFWPLTVSTDGDTIFADLQPIKDGSACPTENVLARLFP
jgi:hypothetical protein